MRSGVRASISAFVVAVLTTGVVTGRSGTAAADPLPEPAAVTHTMPSVVPSAHTPAVDDGAVMSIAQVGSTMVLGGTFSSVGGASHPYLVAFNATSGAVSTTFVPNVDGAVNSVAAGPTAGTVYVGGDFTHVNGAAAKFVTLLNVSTGQVAAGWHTPQFNYGYVNDLILRGTRLFIGGVFTKINGANHAGLATLKATTGALDPFMNVQLTGHHNDSGSGAQGWIGAANMAMTANGATLAVIGNFKNANGQLRNQAALIKINGSSAVLAPWATTGYAPYCFNSGFDQTVRDVAFSPSGGFFVITATGGGNPGTLCDAVARFDTNLNNANAQPAWVDQSGGDTLWGVTVTNSAVFVGGHNRWMNNPNGVDSPQAGAVPRPGLQALDPVSGRPLAWNPGRVPLGVAVFCFLVTNQGLWLGSDTDYIGNYTYKRPKIVLFPFAGGVRTASTNVASLPGRVFLGGSNGGQPTLTRVAYDGTTATPTSVSNQNIDFQNWHGAFLVGRRVFYGYSDNYLYYRTFNGTTFGPAVKIDPYHDPKWAGVQTGDGDTFDGALPDLYQYLGNITGMVYDRGRLYLTARGDSHLYSVWFSPDSGIVDQTIATQTSSVDFSSADGLFVSGGNLYYGSADGSLRRVPFANGTVSGSPTVVSGPGTDGVNWINTAMFLTTATGTPDDS